MSYASTSFQTAYIADDTSVTVALLAVGGDLEQVYTGPATAPDILSDNWDTATTKPILANVVMESDPTLTQTDIAGAISDADTRYYINGLELEFDSNGLSVDSTSGGATGYAGCFRKLTAAAGTRHRAEAPCGGLEVLKNLVTASGGVSFNVSVVLAIVIGSKGVRKQGGTVIKMRQSTGTANVASIYCDSGQSFILDESHPSVTCKARFWRGGSQVTPSSYKWYLLESGVWVQKATTATFTVGTGDIDTFGDVKVEGYDAQGNLIASDMQTVADSSDGFVVAPNPSPADAVFLQTGGPSQIVFSPKLLTVAGANGPSCMFLFTVLDSAGNIQNPTDNTVKKTTYTLLKSVATSINEGPTVNITAVEP